MSIIAEEPGYSIAGEIGCFIREEPGTSSPGKSGISGDLGYLFRETPLEPAVTAQRGFGSGSGDGGLKPLLLPSTQQLSQHFELRGLECGLVVPMAVRELGGASCPRHSSKQLS